MNRKIRNAVLTAALLTGLTVSAKTVLEFNPKSSEISGMKKIYKQSGVKISPEGISFSGDHSYLHLVTLKPYETFSVAMRVELAELPKDKAAFVVRRGYNNMIGCDKEGRVFIEIWGNNKKEHLLLKSQIRMTAGKVYSIVGIVDRTENKNQIKLFVNGHLEGDARLGCPVFPYGTELILGNANPYGNGAFPMKGKISNLRIFDSVPTAKDLENWKNDVGLNLDKIRREGFVSVADFGAFPGDGIDDTEAVRKALAFACSAKIPKLVFPRGVYDFFDQAPGKPWWVPEHWVFDLKNVKNLEIDGGNSFFLFHGIQCFAFSRQCENIVYKNMTLDYKKPYYTYGTAENVTADQRTFDVRFDSSFSPNGGEPVPSWSEVETGEALNVNGGLFVCFRVSKTRLVAPDRLRIYATDRMKNLSNGMKILLRHHTYTGCLFSFHNSSNHKLENVTIHGGNGMGVTAQYLNGLELKNVKIMPSANAPCLLSTSSDAINLLGCRGKIIISGALSKGRKTIPSISSAIFTASKKWSIPILF